MTPPTHLQRCITSAAPRTGAVLGILMVLTAMLAGCGPEPRTSPAPEGLTQDEFVAVIVALREAERDVTESLAEGFTGEITDDFTGQLPDELADEAREDSAAVLFVERKRQILEEHDTSEEEVRAFILANGGNLDLLESTWGAIEERLKHVRTAADEPGDTMRQGALERAESLVGEGAMEGRAVPLRPDGGMRIVPGRKDLERIR